VRLAIIPARGGSKRIPRKNIKDFQGMPIIGYAIDAARKSGCFDEVMVSTEDWEIREIAEQLGAVIPFYRSARNANDHIGTVPVLLEVLERYAREIGSSFTDVCCIYPCNPFLTAEKLKGGLDKHAKSRADSTFPVVKYSYPPQRALRLDGWGTGIEMIHPENYESRSQDLDPIYHDAGQFYWLRTLALAEQQKLFMKRSTPLIYSELEVQDIDTLEDWTLAEVKYQLWRNNSQYLSSEQVPKEHSAP
jgi:N-acylneuraminate cytidylyltransferase